VDGYSGDAGNALMAAQAAFVGNGQMFTTLDRDNDVRAHGNCGRDHRGGWWYEHCSMSELNQDIHGCWQMVGSHRDVQDSRMLVKLN